MLIFEEIELVDVQINDDSRHCGVNPGSARVNVENKAILLAEAFSDELGTLMIRSEELQKYRMRKMYGFRLNQVGELVYYWEL